MSVSKHADHFFQTSTSLEESDRKRRKASNTLGSPIKLPSKILAVKTWQSGGEDTSSVLVAEAGGTVSNVSLSSRNVQRIGRGSQAPMTSIATFTGRSRVRNQDLDGLIFAGGWDRAITRFEFKQEQSLSDSPTAQESFKAHTDFVKCILVARTPDKHLVLLSGGADGDVNIWSFEGRRLACLRPQSRGIECLVLDPYSTPEDPRVFFSTSQREIYHFALPPLEKINGSISISAPIIQHETSVYKLEFDNDGDLWTASADKTAKRLVRENGFVGDTTLVHPDFVRDIVIYNPSGLAITACRDEEVRVWNAGTSQLLHVFAGHFEEVTGLALVGNILVSISIDATLRQWSLAPQDLSKAIEESRNPKLLESEPEPSTTVDGLTEEEEAELQALMEEEEADTLEKMAKQEQ